MSNSFFKVLFFCSIICFCFTNRVDCQLWSQFGLATLNPYREVAAYGGLDRVTMLSAQLRSQWAEFNGSPKSQYIGVHSPVYLWKGAAGMDLMNQSHGNIKVRRLRLSYNYVNPISFGLMSFGLRAGFIQASINGGGIITPDGEYEDGIINHNDPNLNDHLVNGFNPTWEISTAFSADNWSGGLSFANFPQTMLKANSSVLTFKSQLNFYFKYFFQFSEELGLQASSVIRSDLINYQSEFSGIFRINGNIFGGLLLRGYSSSSIDALGFIFGHSINNNFSLFYSYEFGMSRLNTSHQGSHEILLKYRINKLFGTGLPPKIIYNPRFL